MSGTLSQIQFALDTFSIDSVNLLLFLNTGVPTTIDYHKLILDIEVRKAMICIRSF